MEIKKLQNERKTVRIEMRKKPQEVSGKCHKGGSDRDNVSTDSKNQKRGSEHIGFREFR